MTATLPSTCLLYTSLVASHIYLDVVSVGATINIMMAAAMAEGQTILENAAKEPHICLLYTSRCV